MKIKSKDGSFRKLIWPAITLIVIWLLFLRPEINIRKLKCCGMETKALVYRKSTVGSKGTIRCFYRFNVRGSQYKGFYDNEKINQGDSIWVIYYVKKPSINKSKQFVVDFN